MARSKPTPLVGGFNFVQPRRVQFPTFTIQTFEVEYFLETTPPNEFLTELAKTLSVFIPAGMRGLARLNTNSVAYGWVQIVEKNVREGAGGV